MPLTLWTASFRLVPPCSVTTARGTTTTLCGRSASLVPVLSDAGACSSGAVELALPPGPAACAATPAAGCAAVTVARAPARRRVLTARFGFGAETTTSGIVVPARGAGVDGAGDGAPGWAGATLGGVDGALGWVGGALGGTEGVFCGADCVPCCACSVPLAESASTSAIAVVVVLRGARPCRPRSRMFDIDAPTQFRIV